VPSTLPVGARIHNRYVVLAHLGGGVNGEVYRVLDERQRIEVALKMLDLAHKPPGGWYVEAEFLTQLRGDFILPILNADDEAGVPFIVTEIMANGSTADQIVPGIGVPVDKAATWVQQACAGISRIHDKRVLHNDIKPANLFLDEDENVLVGDFGLVCPMDKAGNGHAAGSAETLAPDVITAGVSNVRTDVYSLGATLYELIAGHWLNPAITHLADPAVVYPMVVAHTPVPIGNVAPHVPVGLRSIIMKAVDPNPAKRYADPGELGAAIGGRAKQRRTWVRTVPCPGHTMCFIGTRPGANDYQVCAVPINARGRHHIRSRHVHSGQKLSLPWPEVSKSQVAVTLRSRIAALT
jgi:eukaryotic-like serine/threonine-protein kinase